MPGVKELVICGVPVNNADYDEVQAFVVPERLSAESLEKYAGKSPSAALRSYKICASQNSFRRENSAHLPSEAQKVSSQEKGS